MLLCVNIPGTYYAPQAVQINDKHGDLFYARVKPGNFNLPVGKYEVVEGTVTLTDNFIPFPSIEQDDPVGTTGLQLEIGDNPNKATFYADKNKAVIDKFIIDVPFKPARIFCVLHEQGHTYYRPPAGTMAALKKPLAPGYDEAYKNYLTAECMCDIFAYNKMMRNGYNPSQVRLAARLIFRPDNERLDILDKQILQVNNNQIV